MAKVALCVIATNDYIDFVPPLLESAEAYFLASHEVDYHVFSNKFFITAYHNLTFHEIQHEPWPAMTLKRYEIMSAIDFSGYDYCYYIDADMLFVAPVGDEIFGELVGVRHPGYYKGGGAWETNPKSAAYVQKCKRRVYLAGGFQGGSYYAKSAFIISEAIHNDTIHGITAKWHDESHWNALYTRYKAQFKLLDPSYCMVEEQENRKAWRIDHFEPKIIALSKDHSKYQK